MATISRRTPLLIEILLLLSLLLRTTTAWTVQAGLNPPVGRRRAPILRAQETVNVELTRPMGIVFEENEPAKGGVYIAELQPSHLRKFGAVLNEGDQLVAVGGDNAEGLSFEDAMGLLIHAEEDVLGLVSLTFVRCEV